MAIRPNLIAVVNMDSGIMGYFPMNPENKRDSFSNLAKIKLRYHFDPIFDFIDADTLSNLLSKENEVISNI